MPPPIGYRVAASCKSFSHELNRKAGSDPTKQPRRKATLAQHISSFTSRFATCDHLFKVSTLAVIANASIDDPETRDSSNQMSESSSILSQSQIEERAERAFQEYRASGNVAPTSYIINKTESVVAIIFKSKFLLI